MKGLIFDIQRSSLVDGEGVRTAVFFKGCNLRCKWCHNPEGIDKTPSLLYYKSRCTSCGECVSVCERGQGECLLCGKCAIACPQNARQLCGREYSACELLDVICRDTDVYLATGGGVTLSGGECMLQIDFLEELLRLCRERGINTAVDTAGNVPQEYFERIIPYVNTFLFDVKCATDTLHREFTGVSNKLILNNLEYLLKRGCEVVVRVPVVGGFNASEDEMNRIFELLKGKGVKKAELLPYHRLGEHKYEGAGLTLGAEFTVPNESQTEKFKRTLGETL